MHILSPFLNQQKGENDRRKYFMINFHERMLPTSAGVEPATSWSQMQRIVEVLGQRTVDETWVHYYEPENKAQSRQWVGPGSPRAKKFKVQPSAGKVMATVFWDAQGVTMLDFLAKKSTITGAYYANLLDQLRTAIREKR